MSQERPGTEDERVGPAAAGEADPGSDTEGHSMLAYELGVNVTRDRQRHAERAAQDARRTGDRPRRGLLDRLRGR